LDIRQTRINYRFNFDAIGEVAAIFTGIFICMQPAQQIVAALGAAFIVQRSFRTGRT
jgi:hypothetical protein